MRGDVTTKEFLNDTTFHEYNERGGDSLGGRRVTIEYIFLNRSHCKNTIIVSQYQFP